MAVKEKEKEKGMGMELALDKGGSEKKGKKEKKRIHFWSKVFFGRIFWEWEKGKRGFAVFIYLFLGVKVSLTAAAFAAVAACWLATYIILME